MLQDVERLKHTILTAAPIVLLAFDRKGVVIVAEGKGLEAGGVTAVERIGRSAFDLYRDTPGVCAALRNALTGITSDIETEFRGHHWSVHFEPLRDAAGDIVGASSVAVEITARKNAEARVIEVNKALRMLSAANRTLIKAESEVALLEDMCRAAVEVGGYVMAWVGFRDDESPGGVVAAASAGNNANFVNRAIANVTSRRSRRGPVIDALHTRTTQVINDVSLADLSSAWHEAAHRAGFRSAIGLPIRVAGRLFGAFGLYAAEADAFDQDAVDILEEMAGDLGFGIETLRTRAGRAQSLELVQAIMDSSTDGVAALRAIRDSSGRLVDVTVETANPPARRMLQLPSTTLPHLGLLEAAPAAVSPRLLDTISTVLATGRPQEVEYQGSRDGADVWYRFVIVPRGDDGVVTTIADVTERKRLELELAHRALHDHLTDLPNRVLLDDRLDQGIARRRRQGHGLSLLFLDVDHFKVINDGLGHSAGDALLIELARRMQANSRPGDTVARFGGDEFVVICEGLTHDEAVAIAERLRKAVCAPIAWGERTLSCTVSIGIVTPVSLDVSAEDLLRDADAAMYQAKGEGRNRTVTFTDSMRAAARERLDIEVALRRALDEHQFRLHYQPVVELATRRIVGVEALVRWQHPERGLLPPGAFLDAAEETGIIVAIDRWALTEACRQGHRWHERFPEYRSLSIAVNVSAREVTEPGYGAAVLAVVKEAGIEPSTVFLELTETVLMADALTTSAVLVELGEHGLQLSVDDFGTGYSSLAYLKRFPLNVLKIDRSFISNLEEDAEDAAIVEAVLAMASTLNLDVVAEGVETEAQAARLRDSGCAFAQGFYFSRPISAQRMTRLLAGARQTDPPSREQFEAGAVPRAPSMDVSAIPNLAASVTRSAN